ncbi:hypothetical protein NDU88_009322 [Pleurodeles waltl]|uniref:Uncharacterized protein n=1 Tax=Pleurodeles waltl TaxID=8319 RepID=A0AAV7QSM5_PLEWA|nr:hypothetical protein NDU88_009322 [Pleurodeles waltl]
MATAKGLSMTGQADDPTVSALDTRMDCILQEITAVGRRLEGMDSNISMLKAETKSIHMDIVGFQNRVTEQEHCISVAEDVSILYRNEIRNSSSSEAKSST